MFHERRSIKESSFRAKPVKNEDDEMRLSSWNTSTRAGTSHRKERSSWGWRDSEPEEHGGGPPEVGPRTNDGKRRTPAGRQSSEGGWGEAPGWGTSLRVPLLNGKVGGRQAEPGSRTTVLGGVRRAWKMEGRSPGIWHAKQDGSL